MAVIHIGTEVTLATISVDDISNNDIAYVWLNDYTRKMIFNSTSTLAEDTTDHPYAIRPNDFASAGVWIEDVGADEPQTWNGDNIVVTSGNNLLVQDGGNIVFEAGGNIVLGGGSSSAKIIFDGASNNLNIYTDASGTTSSIKPDDSTGSPTLNFGQTSPSGFYQLGFYTYNSILMNAYYDASNYASFVLDNDAGGAPTATMLVNNDGTISGVELKDTGTPYFYPTVTSTTDLGTSSYKWKDFYISGNGYVSDNSWIGLGAAKGRIEFDDQATDEVNFLDCSVGIGTTSPAHTLEISRNDSDLQIRLARVTTNAGYVDLGGSANGLRIHTSTSGEVLRVLQNGNVGIGTVTPTALLDINSDILRLRTSKTPASASAPGNAGDICWDSNYLYICITTDTWKRSAIATW